MTVGIPIEGWCTGQLATAPERLFVRNNGTIGVKVDAKAQPIWLYDVSAGLPVLVEQTCNALFDDDPTTTAPEPMATGTANLKVRVSILPTGDVEVTNGINGIASSQHTTWKVPTWTDFTVVDGVPQGDPAEFRGVDIQQVRRNHD